MKWRSPDSDREALAMWRWLIVYFVLVPTGVGLPFLFFWGLVAGGIAWLAAFIAMVLIARSQGANLP